MTVKKSPQEKTVYGAMGTVKRMLEKEVATKLKEYTGQCFWGADMLVLWNFQVLVFLIRLRMLPKVELLSGIQRA